MPVAVFPPSPPGAPHALILGLTLLTGLAFGCGDDDGPVGPGTDAGMRDAGTRDSGGGTDSGPDDDAGTDGIEKSAGSRARADVGARRALDPTDAHFVDRFGAGRVLQTR